MVRASLWVQEKKSLLAATEDNKDASSMITGGKNLNDYNMSNSLKKKTLMEKAKDILKKKSRYSKRPF
jgi:hypothetical protein